MRLVGDPSADNEFLHVFVQHEDALRAYARSLLPNWEAVDEVLQESSVVMWRKFDQLDDESGFLPWAKVIVRFESLKARRNAARDMLWFSDELIEVLGDEDAGVESEAELYQEREALDHGLSKLEKDQRELVLMPYRDHGSITKLAETTSKTVNSYYKKIGRIRNTLSSCIEGQIGTPQKR